MRVDFLGCPVLLPIYSPPRHIVSYKFLGVDGHRFNSGCRSYKYRQNSDFWYLTGFAEPDSAVILGMYGRASSRFSKFKVHCYV